MYILTTMHNTLPIHVTVYAVTSTNVIYMQFQRWQAKQLPDLGSRRRYGHVPVEHCHGN